jgi:hypothetical protein
VIDAKILVFQQYPSIREVESGATTYRFGPASATAGLRWERLPDFWNSRFIDILLRKAEADAMMPAMTDREPNEGRPPRWSWARERKQRTVGDWAQSLLGPSAYNRG